MKAIKFLFLALGMLTLSAPVFSQRNSIAEITPDSVAAVLANGAVFVDVREPNEVEVLAYDLPGVIYLPLSELPDRMAELPRDQPLLLACRSGKRSMKAANLLAENDFTHLTSLTGGIIGWEAAGFPVLDADRHDIPAPVSTKPCCAAKSAGESGAKSCGGDKAGAKSAGASCGGQGKAKGKSCCAGGSR